MSLVQRADLVGIHEKEGMKKVRISTCFVHRDASASKKSTLSVTIKVTAQGDEYGKVLESQVFDVTGNAQMESGEKAAFQQAVTDFLEKQYPYISLEEERKEPAAVPTDIIG